MQVKKNIWNALYFFYIFLDFYILRTVTKKYIFFWFFRIVTKKVKIWLFFRFDIPMSLVQVDIFLRCFFLSFMYYRTCTKENKILDIFGHVWKRLKSWFFFLIFLVINVGQNIFLVYFVFLCVFFFWSLWKNKVLIFFLKTITFYNLKSLGQVKNFFEVFLYILNIFEHLWSKIIFFVYFQTVKNFKKFDHIFFWYSKVIWGGQ